MSDAEATEPARRHAGRVPSRQLSTEPGGREAQQIFLGTDRRVFVVALLLALTACGSTSEVPTSASGQAEAAQLPDADPYDGASTNKPELLVIDPSSAEAGEQVELTFPQGTSRGVAFTLEREARGGWAWTHGLTSGVDGYGDGRPSWVARGTSFGWDDIGVEGVGPDLILLPDELDPGSYRICTANARSNFCGELKVLPT